MDPSYSSALGHHVAVLDSDTDMCDFYVTFTRKRRCFDDNEEKDNSKRAKFENDRQNHPEVVLPLGFLEPLYPSGRDNNNINSNNNDVNNVEPMSTSLVVPRNNFKQFWKAGDYEGDCVGDQALKSSYSTVGFDHVRVHPRFLHSNATSHKWALGAFAELLDNALDEVCNGATYVKVDMVTNEKNRHNMPLTEKDRYKMLLFQDNGGGMSSDKMRQCMSLGYSAKSKIANTIGQYGNGFKTSTMRLGADVIVFSLCQGKSGSCPTRSIGMLSYTFLTSTGKEDIVVPMINYEKKGHVWTKTLRTCLDDWNTNLDTITEWSPYSSEQELLQQFDFIDDQGTRIIIYNLWEDDMGQLELDFEIDPQDIQIRGVNRDEKKIAMATKYPNSKHFLTYQHSLRSYSSILYLRLPPGFRIILRGKDVEHHNLVNDMSQSKQVQYRPAPINDGSPKDPNVSSENIQVFVTLGFVKDAKDHIDIQGFNVYHKNRLIKPFWRVWNAAGSDGRGVIGLLEADFVEPAHDKQGFERTTALSRLEARLLYLQKNYWRDNCHIIGYAPRRPQNKTDSTMESPPSNNGSTDKKKSPYKSDDSAEKIPRKATSKGTSPDKFYDSEEEIPRKSSRTSVKRYDQRSLLSDDSSEDEMTHEHLKSSPLLKQSHSSNKSEKSKVNLQTSRDHLKSPSSLKHSHSSNKSGKSNSTLQTSPDPNADMVAKSRKDKSDMQNRQEDASESRKVADLKKQIQLEREKCRTLEARLEVANKRIAELDKEHEAIINIFSEERNRRDVEEENMRTQLQAASTTIDQLLEKVKNFERMKVSNCKAERF